MIVRRSIASRRRPPSRSDRGAPRAWRDPALWAWVAVAVFALLPLTHVMAAPAPVAATSADGDELPTAGMMTMPAMPAVKRLSDGELSCTAIYVEVQELERALKVHEAASAASQLEMQQAATAMMDRGAAMSGIGTATSLLGMIPGIGGIVGGMVGGVASQAASAAAMSSARERQGQLMATTQKIVASYQLQAAAGGRRDYLTDLFLQRGCKLAEVKAAVANDAAVAAASPSPRPDASPDGTVPRQDQASAGGGGTP